MLDLTESWRVEEIQLRFAVLLQNYINYRLDSDSDVLLFKNIVSRHPDNLCVARSRFSKGMMLVSKCKEVALYMKKR